MLRAMKNYKYIVFAITALLYNLVYFHRLSTNPIADDLIKDINVNATQLGTISSTYFIFYAVMQPIIGVLADKFGSKKVIVTFLSISIVGCIAFALCHDFVSALIARSLIGLGVSGVLIPSLKLHAEWFKPDQFARVNGLFLGIGHSGALVATTPLAFLSVAYGWRNVFFLFTVIGFVMLVITAIALFDKNQPKDINNENNENKPRMNSREAIKWLVKTRNFWLLIVIFFATFGAYISFQGLWSTKYLVALRGIDTTAANNLISFIPIGVIIGALICGFISDNVFKSRRKPLQIGLILCVICWIPITFFIQSIPDYLISLIFFVMGIGGGLLLPLIFIIIKDCIPQEVVGTCLGFVNPAYFAGIFTYQIVTGIILDATRVNENYTSHSYFIMMLFCLITLIVTTIISFFIVETFKNDEIKIESV